MTTTHLKLGKKNIFIKIRQKIKSIYNHDHIMNHNVIGSHIFAYLYIISPISIGMLGK